MVTTNTFTARFIIKMKHVCLILKTVTTYTYKMFKITRKLLFSSALSAFKGFTQLSVICRNIPLYSIKYNPQNFPARHQLWQRLVGFSPPHSKHFYFPESIIVFSRAILYLTHPRFNQLKRKKILCTVAE